MFIELSCKNIKCTSIVCSTKQARDYRAVHLLKALPCDEVVLHMHVSIIIILCATKGVSSPLR